MKNLLIITGPTASGKSSVCLELAKRHNGIIINCDSKQIYKEIPIITAQPVSYRNVPHRLYGYISVISNYSAGLWLEDLKKEVNKIWQNNQLPIISGGSGMYITSLIKGLSPMPEIKDEIRQTSRELLNAVGKEEFYKILLKKDPLTENKINLNDTHRLVRAFEVISATGISIYTWQKKIPKPVFKDFRLFILSPERSVLYQKINKRFLEMIELGVIKEVEKLLSLNLDPALPAMKAHGVPEIIKYLNQEVTIDEAISVAQTNTRHYAKRQFTWFKHQFPKAIFIKDVEELLSFSRLF